MKVQYPDGKVENLSTKLAYRAIAAGKAVEHVDNGEPIASDEPEGSKKDRRGNSKSG